MPAKIAITTTTTTIILITIIIITIVIIIINMIIIKNYIKKLKLNVIVKMKKKVYKY